MSVIKDLDLKWFWIGYTAGVNSRKRFVESPNKIVNLGKQGVVTTLTDKQKISFFIGVKMGRGKIVQNFDVVRVIQYQDKNAHKNKGDYLTIGVGKKEAQKGQVVSLPLYIANNTVDNRGFCGFQTKIKYNPNHLTLNKISPSSLWTSTFNVEHDTAGGVVLIQGLRDEIGYEDMVVGWLEFTVLDSALSTNTIVVSGPSGKGTGTDILTRINEELYYIQPICLEDGQIKIPSSSTQTTTKPSDSITLPTIGTTDSPLGPNTDFTYDFELDLEWIPDGGTNNGANLGFQITFGDGSTETVYIPLQEGSHRYQGKIPLKLPSIKPGPVIIEVFLKPNDEEDQFYWFIKAGALWGFETTVPRDEVHTIPIVIPKVSVYDGFRIKAEYRLSFEESGGGDEPTPLPDRFAIGEIMQLYDEFASELYEVIEEIELSDLGISDGFRITFEGGLNE